MLARRSASHPVGGFIARRSSCDAMGQELRPQDEAFVERLREKPWRGRLGKELMGRATQWLPGVPRLCLPVLSRRLVLNSVHRSEVSARLSFGVSIMEARFPLQDIDMQISPSSAEPRKGSRGPFFRISVKTPAAARFRHGCLGKIPVHLLTWRHRCRCVRRLWGADAMPSIRPENFAIEDSTC